MQPVKWIGQHNPDMKPNMAMIEPLKDQEYP